MNKKKVCLFTSQSPGGGGGSVILRSMIENLSDISISWQYVNDKIAAGYETGDMGRGFMGGGIIKDVLETWKMLTDKPSSKIDKIVDQLLEFDCDSYWIVSHKEGLRVALELSRRQKERPVHMTIHDDWSGALTVRSVRYRLMAGLATRMTKTALENVTSFDVISKGMRDYYKELSGRDGEVTHRFITSKSVTANQVAENNDSSKITVGHIGSLYEESDFYNFLSVFHEFARMKNKEPVVHMWGCHLPPDKIPVNFRSSVVFHPTLPEDEIIPKLAGCTFVYAMYPMLKRFRLFAKTSLQTKLGSYIQAKRPIFGHGPSESTLAEFLNTTRTGEIWDNTSKASGLDVFEKIINLDPDLSEWQNARDQYFGEKNIEIIRKCVLNLN